MKHNQVAHWYELEKADDGSAHVILKANYRDGGAEPERIAMLGIIPIRFGESLIQAAEDLCLALNTAAGMNGELIKSMGGNFPP